MLFLFNLIIRASQLAKFILKGKKNEKVVGYCLNFLLEMLVWFYTSTLDVIRLEDFSKFMSGLERWLFSENFILKIFLPAIFIVIWFHKRICRRLEME